MAHSQATRVILVGATRKEAKAWRRLLPHLRKAETPGLDKTFVVFDGSKKVRERHFRHWAFPRWPSLSDHAGALESFLRAEAKGATTILVGYHSGCSVIKKALLNLVALNHIDQLGKVRFALMISPKKVNFVRRVFVLSCAVVFLSLTISRLLPHLPLSRFPGDTDVYKDAGDVLNGLGVLAVGVLALILTREAADRIGFDINSLEDSSLDKEFAERISVKGTKDEIGKWPIATGVLANLDLTRLDNAAVETLIQAIECPPGHPNVFELQLRHTAHVLEPDNTGKNPWGIMTITKTFVFSKSNAVPPHSSQDKFEISYGTMVLGGRLTLLEYPDGNLWTEEEKGDFDAARMRYKYKFWPTAGRTYVVKLRVEGGFGPGDMDAHFHARPDTNYGTIREELDLRPTLERGYTLGTPPPSAFYLPAEQPETIGDCRKFKLKSCKGLKDDRNRSNLPVIELKNTATQEGCFRWEITEVRGGGIFAFEYKLERPSSASTG